MSNQHLHNKIGNAIGEARKRLKDRLKSGANVNDATAVFIAELRLEFETIISRSEAEDPHSENVSSESM